ncbi:fluoride efflux transporter FluC [Arsukibacterium sp.]|uniref:fluoride efflux transporter FluC n=1 Tax=Arsukibacterium sp. TaxID=1977258 RepID=UPI002FDB70FF
MVKSGVYLAVASGSALGALLRYACYLGIPVSTDSLPLASLLVNIAGSFLIGVIASISAMGGCWPLSDWQKQGLVAGVCGGFTSFSIVSLELLFMLKQQQWLLAGAYMVLSIGLWLLACWAGLRSGQRCNRVFNAIQ